MKKLLLVTTLSFLMFSALGRAAQVYAYDLTALSGTIQCTGTIQVSGQAAAAETATLVSDGAGNWTSGTASYQITTGAAQGTTCNYTLDNGRYSVNDDGTGVSSTHWTLVKAVPSAGAANASPAAPGIPAAGSSSSPCDPITFGSDDISLPGLTYVGAHAAGKISHSGSCAFVQ